MHHTRNILRIVIMLLLMAAGGAMNAQYTKISGRVTDGTTGGPVPFASVYFEGTSIGVATDENGEFTLETAFPGDSITVSTLGYRTEKIKIVRGKNQDINIKLYENTVNLREFVVVPEEDLIELMMGWIRRNKKVNDAKNLLDHYQYEVYSKVQADLNNFSDDFLDRKVFKPFSFVRDYVDTSEVNRKAYLPVFLSESVSDYFYRKEPVAEKEVIKANKVSGIENESITQFLGSVYQSVNPYDNFIFIFDKNFVSPLADFGDIYYTYNIVDTLWVDNRWCFEVTFSPKRKQALLFSGSMWINDTTFAVKKIKMRMTEYANLNFVSDLVVEQDYQLYDNRYWMVKRDYMLADLNPLEEWESTVGFFIHRTSRFNDFRFNVPMQDEFYSGIVDVTIADEAREMPEVFWQQRRPELLSRKEQGVYNMIDSIKSMPVFRTYLDVIFTITTGYYQTKYFEIGPYYKMLSFNQIEGPRVRLGGRTTKDFNENMRFDGYLAYGFKDRRFKYGAGATFFTSRIPRRTINASFSHDMEQLGQSADAFAEDNFFAAFFRRSPADKLTFVKNYEVNYDHEWFQGFSSSIGIVHRDMFPLNDTRFIIYRGEDVILENSLISTEIQVGTRFAYNEKYVEGKFNRVSIGTRYPVLEVTYGYGVPGLLGGEFEYHKLDFRIKHWFPVFSIGWSKYVFETGKIWGKLPYPLLKLHEGNESFIFFEDAYNLMDYYEFISDRYASLYYTHHFDGWIWNKIPWVRKLKWRTVVHGRAVIGDLTDANKNFSEFPEISGSLDRPYYEAGVGIENIFKFLRVDAVWRLSQLEKGNTGRFGVFASLQFSF